MSDSNKTEHILGGGPMHAGDCPACIESSERAVARRAAVPNPHRPGTKAYAKFEKERYAGLNAIDPRTETYWCM